jgi:gamma-D-glutamyl-L-lysine dipeptidyl-peptidase
MTIESLPINTSIVCRVAVAPLSREAAYSSEMTSQLLFGETCVVTGPAVRKWLPVRCSYDGYEGFVLKNQFEPAPATPENPVYTFCSDGWLRTPDKILLPLGAVLNKQLTDQYTGATLVATQMPLSANNIQLVASLFTNVPYLWGGKSSFGIDCSGLTQMVYRFFNTPLPRDAWQQAETGEAIGFLQEARTGDLAFFDDEAGRIIHTGILLNGHEIIHAAGDVHIDAIDHAGIVNKRTGERTHRLRIIKRVSSF